MTGVPIPLKEPFFVDTGPSGTAFCVFEGMSWLSPVKSNSRGLAGLGASRFKISAGIGGRQRCREPYRLIFESAFLRLLRAVFLTARRVSGSG
jgi:hypothetical protein